MNSFIDINECNSNNAGCDHTCENTDGTYVCSCKAGYELNNDQHSCEGKEHSYKLKFMLIIHLKYMLYRLRY